MFFGIMQEFANHVSFTVIPFDTEVKSEEIFRWDKGKKVEPSRVCRGGTDFNAPTKWVNSRDFDGHIILTDMEAEKPVRSKCKRIWVVPKRRHKAFKTREKVVELLPDD